MFQILNDFLRLGESGWPCSYSMSYVWDFPSNITNVVYDLEALLCEFNLIQDELEAVPWIADIIEIVRIKRFFFYCFVQAKALLNF